MCFFNDATTTEIYTLSLHDALPIWDGAGQPVLWQEMAQLAVAVRGPHRDELDVRTDREQLAGWLRGNLDGYWRRWHAGRSEEHTSELQSRQYLVWRLLLEKKKTNEY